MRRLAVLLTLLSFGCRGEPTQVVVIVDAQHGVREQSGSVSVEIRGGDRGTMVPETVVHSVTETMEYDDWPIRFVLGPENGDATRVYQVEAVARRGAGMSSPALVTGRVISNYNDGRTLQVYLLLEDLCIGVRCDDPGQTCRGGACAGAFREPDEYTDGAVPDAGATPTCASDADCDDGVACTTDRCTRGFCLHTGDDAQCMDAIACTRGVCTPAGCQQEPVDAMCNDGVPCTADRCDVTTGCVATPDDDRCTAAADGTCDATNGCQYPVCNAETCVVENDCQSGASCDGDVCVRPPLCAGGGCCEGVCTDCNDNDPCTADVCTEGVGCENPPLDGGSCDDGLTCTTEGFCAGGTCMRGSDTCDDGNPCTADMCGAAGCMAPPVADGTPCDNRDGCPGDTCRGGSCRAASCGGMDAGVDSGIDSGVDSGVDSGTDGGLCGGGQTSCTGTSGFTCCDPGDDCCDGICCPSGTCIGAGVCDTPGPDGGSCGFGGEFCSGSADCCDGICCNGVCCDSGETCPSGFTCEMPFGDGGGPMTFDGGGV